MGYKPRVVFCDTCRQRKHRVILCSNCYGNTLDRIAELEAHVTNDRYWCLEGCGFVDRNHRCEQWSQVLRIPAEAINRIKDESGGE